MEKKHKLGNGALSKSYGLHLMEEMPKRLHGAPAPHEEDFRKFIYAALGEARKAVAKPLNKGKNPRKNER